jgi:hypothetical protein
MELHKRSARGNDPSDGPGSSPPAGRVGPVDPTPPSWPQTPPSWPPTGPSWRPAGTPPPAGLLAINLRYFALRAAVFGAVLAAVLLLGVDGLLAFALAVTVSGLISYPLALRQRRAVVNAVAARHGPAR